MAVIHGKVARPLSESFWTRPGSAQVFPLGPRHDSVRVKYRFVSGLGTAYSQSANRGQPCFSKGTLTTTWSWFHQVFSVLLTLT